MKTEIKINHENLSRYSKRTQKVLKEVLGQDVKLNEANLILSKILGVNSTHELKKLLEYDLIEDFKERLHRNPQETPLEKVLLITKQIQKMMLDTDIKMALSYFNQNFGGYSIYENQSDFNKIKCAGNAVSFENFNVSDSERKKLDIDTSIIADYYDRIMHSCVSIIDNDVYQFEKSLDYRFNQKAKTLPDSVFDSMIKIKSIMDNKFERKKINKLSNFADRMSHEITKYLKGGDDFWLVERNKITIKIGDDLTVYQ